MFGIEVRNPDCQYKVVPLQWRHRPLSDKQIERFWSKVSKTDGCWEWTGSTIISGYGQYAQRLAHRIAYELTSGEIPRGKVIHHRCENKLCVNPEHLEMTSQSNNMKEAWKDKSNHNAQKTHCPQGHPYSGDNLYVNPKNGRRTCRICRKASKKRYEARMKNGG